VNAAIPALGDLAAQIGDPHIRHRGTIGGSLANNDPAADYPAAVLALNARMTTSERVIAADNFFAGMFETSLRPDEILRSVAFARPRRAAYVKFRSTASRYALTGVFVADTGSGIRVAVTGAGPCVFRQTEMEAALASNWSVDALNNVQPSPEGLIDDIHGSA